jgi:pyruvate/2-oxoglutarate dehydrogenase complex dihydrolipoamide acyltransferase (E2) component
MTGAVSRLFRAPRQGNLYARIRLDVGDVLPRLVSDGLTITPLLAAAAGRALAVRPALTGRIVLGRVRPRDSIVVSVVVALGEGDNLAVVRIPDADTTSVPDIAARIDRGAERLRRGDDDDFEQSMRAVDVTPMALLKPGLALTGWLSGGLGITNRPLGLHEDPLGSLCLSNIGGLGLDEAFSPPTPFAYAPVDLLVGSVTDRPVAIEGQAVVRPTVTLNLTVDARVADWADVDAFAGALRGAVSDLA